MIATAFPPFKLSLQVQLYSHVFARENFLTKKPTREKGGCYEKTVRREGFATGDAAGEGFATGDAARRRGKTRDTSASRQRESEHAAGFESEQHSCDDDEQQAPAGRIASLVAFAALFDELFR